MAVYDVMHTSNPIHEYEFSWTIDNFSLTLDVIKGPTVSPIPGFFEKAYLELQFQKNGPYFQHNINNHYNSSICIYLRNLNIKDNVPSLSWDLVLHKINDDIIEKNATSSTTFYSGIRLLSCIYYSSTSLDKLKVSEKINLPQDKLVVKGKITFWNYTSVSSVASSTVKTNYEAIGDLSKDFELMYRSGSSSDATISVGGLKLPCHKTILSSRSPVFAKMFDQNMLEGNTNNVIIDDTDGHVFDCFLLFLYTGRVEDKNRNTVLSLYSLAHKYEVGSLHRICSKLLRSGLAIYSVCSVLVLSDLHGDKELKDACKLFIRAHLMQVAGRVEWCEIVTAKSHLAEEVLANKDKAS